MSKLAIIGTIEVMPGRRDEVLALLMAHRARCLKDEPGTLQFEVLVPSDDDAKILLYELYQDAAAFEAHWNGAIYCTSARRSQQHDRENLRHQVCALGVSTPPILAELSLVKASAHPRREGCHPPWHSETVRKSTSHTNSPVRKLALGSQKSPSP